MKTEIVSEHKLYFIKVKEIFAFMKSEHFSFWMICLYLFFEYARPQAIIPAIDVLPWAQLLILLSLVGAFFDKTVKWVSSSVNVALVLMSAAIFFSIQFAEYPEISKQHYIDFYSWILIYFLIINIVNSRQRYYIFTLIFLICAAKISIGTSKSWALRGFSFSSWGLMGPKGYFQNSGELAILMLTLFPVAFKLYSLIQNCISKLEKFLLMVFWVTPLLTILGASSRGAQLALVFVCALMFRKTIFKIKPLIIGVILFFALFQLLPEEQKDRFRSAGDDRTSQQRLLYWKHGIEIIRENPLLGIGFFNFPKYYEQYYSHDLLMSRPELPHNIFIQVGTDAGVLGLAPFVYVILYCFLQGKKVAKLKGNGIERALIVGHSFGILGFVVAGQFVTVTYYPFLWIGLAFIVSGSNIISKKVN